MSNAPNNKYPSRDLATQAAMLMAERLEAVGIRTVIVGQEEARRAYDGHPEADFSVADIQRLNYEWNGEEVSLQAFARAFTPLIKNRDRTIADVERIALAYIAGVKAAPEGFVPQLKAENMSHARYFVLRDGTVYSPSHPMASSPEYGTQRGLWEVYSRVLGEGRMAEFVRLLDPSRSRTAEEDARFVAMEREVSASDLMQRSLEVNAERVNEGRVKAVRDLVQYLDASPDYTPWEKAVILKGAMTWGICEKKGPDGASETRPVRLTDANDIAVPVVGGEAAAVAEGLRKGMDFKSALKEARERGVEGGVRSVPRNYTGWKVYRKSGREEDAAVLNRDAAGTGWCTGAGLSTARSHLSGGDFHIYFEAGEPLIAVRTEDGRMAEPPRGAHEGQFCTAREEQIAFDYIRGGNGIEAGDDYVADIEDIRRIMSPDATWKDAFAFPLRRRYENGEFGGDTGAWGEAVDRRIDQLISGVPAEERHREGYYLLEEAGLKLAGTYGIKDEYLSRIKVLRGDGTVVFKRDCSLSAERLVVSVKVDCGVTMRADALQSVGGYLSVWAGSTLRADALKSVGGHLCVYEGSILQADALQNVGGDILLRKGSTLQADALQSVGGELSVCAGSILQADALQSVGGDLSVYEGCTLQADALQNVGGDILLCEGTTLRADALKSVGGNLRVYDATLQADALQNVGGDILLRKGSTLRVDALKSVGGNIRVYRDATLQVDALQDVGGYLSVYDGSTLRADALQSVGGELSVCAGSTLQADALQSVGGELSVYEGCTLQAGSLQDAGGYLYVHRRATVHAPLLKRDFHLSDGSIYGYQMGDTIYLTPEGINPDTPIHEYAHLWAKTMQRIDPERWAQTKRALKSLPVWEAVARSEGYRHLRGDEDRTAEEVLATVTGNRGAAILRDVAGEFIEGKRGEKWDVGDVVDAFRETVSGFAVRSVFGRKEDLDVTDVTMSVLVDFANGKRYGLGRVNKDAAAALDRWQALLRGAVKVVGSVDGVGDPAIAARLLQGRRIRGWYSPSDDTAYIYAPNISTAVEADKTVMQEVVGYKGLQALLGRRGYEDLCVGVWERLYTHQKDRILPSVGGDPDERDTMVAAGAEYIGRTAEGVLKDGPAKEGALRAWNFVMSVLHSTQGDILRMTGMDRSSFSLLMAASVRQYRRQVRLTTPDIPKEQVSAALDAEFLRLAIESMNMDRVDVKRIYSLGHPGTVFLNSSPKARRLPFELSHRALFGKDNDKQVRHPYRFSSLRGLVGELDGPLAVFDSRDFEKPDTLVVLTRLKEERDGDVRHFIVPVTPFRKQDGRWVNNIDSIYPKPDLQLLHWLVNPRGLVRYLAPDFEKEWLEPATERIRAYYESEIEALEQNNRTDGKQLFNPAELGIRTGLLKEEYDRVVSNLGSVANLVKNFENPSIPEENVRFFKAPAQDREVRIQSGSPLSMYNYLQDDEKVSRVAGEYRSAVLSVLEGGIRPVHQPRMISGALFTDAGALHLRLRMMANPCWCPFFVNNRQLHQLGIRACGEPVSIVFYNKRTETYTRAAVYNLSETDFPAVYPASYRRLLEEFREAPQPGVHDVAHIFSETFKDSLEAPELARFLTLEETCGMCGAEFPASAPSMETVLDEMSNLGDYGLYRLFASVGARCRKANIDNHILPETSEPLDRAIGMTASKADDGTARTIKAKI